MAPRTFYFRNVHSEGIALLQDTLSSAFDELVKASSELRHALSQVIEAEIDAGERVCH